MVNVYGIEHVSITGDLLFGPVLRLGFLKDKLFYPAMPGCYSFNTV